ALAGYLFISKRLVGVEDPENLLGGHRDGGVFRFGGRVGLFGFVLAVRGDGGRLGLRGGLGLGGFGLAVTSAGGAGEGEEAEAEEGDEGEEDGGNELEFAQHHGFQHSFGEGGDLEGDRVRRLSGRKQVCGVDRGRDQGGGQARGRVLC